MARGKKAKKLLMPEEKLEKMLVPVEEQPYEVPGNWCWIHLLESFENNTDSKKKVPRQSYLKSGKWAVVDQGKELIGGYIDDEDMKFSGQLPVIIFGDHTRCIKYVNFPFAQGADGIKVLMPKSFYEPRAFYYALQSIHIPNMGYRRHYPLFSKFCIPVPPFAEQLRIVQQIERLFCKLDEAKEKAQAVVDSFELRKSAILHKAFTGELTKQWRIRNNLSLNDWKYVKFGDLGILERGRSKHRPRNDPKLFGGQYPFIQTGDVARSGMYVVEHSQTLSEIGMEQSRMFPKGTLCITIAANIGDVSILAYDCCFPDSVVGFIPNGLTSSKYIYYMMSTVQRELEANAPATAQKNINLKILNELRIKLPSFDEQNEIICILEKLFEKEEQVKSSAETVLEQIDTIKKSILARAFCSALGTNNPMDESALELLQRLCN